MENANINNGVEAANQILNEMWEQGQNGNENPDMEVDDAEEGDGNLDGGIAVDPDSNPDEPQPCDSVRRRWYDLHGTVWFNHSHIHSIPFRTQVLYFACDEVLSFAPNHPILKPGVTVSIRFPKNTKLAAVFGQYVHFCNQSANERISARDLEFVHCQVLQPNDTMEASALMKNDKVKVREIRTAERNDEAERKRMQRSVDANYFAQLRQLMPEFGAKHADIVLDCQGKLLDESGRNQQVLSTLVRAHSPILSKRCPWLGAIIQKARSEAAQKGPIDVTPDYGNSSERACRVESEGKTVDEEGDHDDDTSIEVMPVQPNRNMEDDIDSTGSSGANEIENDDEDENGETFSAPRGLGDTERSESPVFSSYPQKQRATCDKHLLHVTLRNHAPEAVKLLLEYCYTNRVKCLGKDAFATSCSVPPIKHKGPVPPYHMTSTGSRRWPKEGRPLVSFPVALAGIVLAEEASMHRLSLMCEVAAAKLVSQVNVVEALTICTSQKTTSGNDLPRLRRAAMDIVLRSGARGVAELGRSPSFRKALDERRAKIIPTLLKGTTETVARYEKRGKRGGLNDHIHIPSDTSRNFDEIDREDSFEREQERRKRRKEHGRAQDHAYDEAIYDDPSALWASLTSKRSLKRMSQHLDTMRAVSSRGVRGRKTVVSRSSGL
eukprot:scaffold345_cov134-Cylindrotheca_fusiformis.AAC.42